MRRVVNLALLILIVLVAGNTLHRYQQLRAEPISDNWVPGDERMLSDRLAEQQKLIALSEEMKIPDEAIPKLEGSPSKIVEGKSTYQYLCFLPRAYAETQQKYPLILFLHGAGAKGDDLTPLYRHGPIEYLSFREDNRFIAVSPLCPENSGWIPYRLHNFLKEILRKYPIDTSRIYLTGMSMGGHGTWALACGYPNTFAAVVPLCGSGDPKKAAQRLTHVPVWVVHGMKDEVVPVRYGQRMIHALQEAGGNVKASLFPEMGHGEVLGVYHQEEFYTWLLQQQRRRE